MASGGGAQRVHPDSGSGQPCRGSWRTTGLAAATGADEEPPVVAARASHEPHLGVSTAHLTLSSQGLH